MKKIILLIVSSIVTIFFLNRDTLAINRIFLIDTSGSMKRAGLFDRIKESLKQEYVSKMKKGEHIIILSFDEKVVIAVDKRIEGEDDIRKVNRQIDSLKAVGRWTWMSKAFEMTIKQAKRLRTQYPKEGLNIYILTDGINDPPPSSKESPLSFVKVLFKYLKDFKDLKIEKNYVYVLVYKEKIPPDIKEIKKEVDKKTNEKVKIYVYPPTSSKPIPSEVHIGYSGFNFGTINLIKGDVTKRGTIGIKELKGDAVGKVISISVEIESSHSQHISFDVNPKTFKIYREGQIEKISLKIPQKLPPGKYTVNLKLSSSDKVLITPNKIPVKFVIINTIHSYLKKRDKEKSYNFSWLWKLLIIILFFLLPYILLLIFRKKTLYVQKNEENNFHEVKIKNIKKSFLNVVGLPNYYVAFGIYPHEVLSVFLFKDNKKEKKIIIGEHINCEDPQKNNVIITFHDKPFNKVHSVEKDNNLDFFKEKKITNIDKGDIEW